MVPAPVAAGGLLGRWGREPEPYSLTDAAAQDALARAGETCTDCHDSIASWGRDYPALRGAALHCAIGADGGGWACDHVDWDHHDAFTAESARSESIMRERDHARAMATELRDERDHALARAEEVETQLVRAQSRADQTQHELDELRDKIRHLLQHTEALGMVATQTARSGRNWRGRLHDLGSYGTAGGSSGDRRLVVQIMAELEEADRAR